MDITNVLSLKGYTTMRPHRESTSEESSDSSEFAVCKGGWCFDLETCVVFFRHGDFS